MFRSPSLTARPRAGARRYARRHARRYTCRHARRCASPYARRHARPHARRRVPRAMILAAPLALGACTPESLRVALQAQQRANDVQQAVFDQQHDALRVLAYRDLASRLAAGGAPLTDAQRAALNDAWNQRDLFEFWAVQHERAKALRAAAVDARLYADQSIIDLLYKALSAKMQRVKEGYAARLGAGLTASNDQTSATSAEEDR